MQMKKLIFPILLFSVFLVAFLTGCSGSNPENKQTAEPKDVVKNEAVIGNETSLLLKDLEGNGDYVNSQVFPSLIKASIVHESLDSNILVVDLRSSGVFSEGHIKGAVNKEFKELPTWLESGIKPFEYDKIVLVCDDGQVSSYTACLLRLMGYGNVYGMRWGMSAWNQKYAQAGWLTGVSGKYESSLEKIPHERPAAIGMPELKTGFTTGAEIGAARFKTLFEQGTSSILISADEVFANPEKFFIINLERKDKYEDGHIPGAVRYKPEGTLGFVEEMATIPADKSVVVYCGTGHNSGFATAYLRLFGYDARTLKFGNSSFMYDKMVSQKAEWSWMPFAQTDINDFEVTK
jgi:rhodanese-related sulfurtransferase